MYNGRCTTTSLNAYISIDNLGSVKTKNVRIDIIFAGEDMKILLKKYIADIKFYMQ